MKRKVIIHKECELTQLTLLAIKRRAEEADKQIEQLRPLTLSTSKKVRKKARREIEDLRRDLRRYTHKEWKYLQKLGLVEFVD